MQEQSYYPFGLQMSGISDKAINKLNNQNKFNGGFELEEDYGVNLYSTFYRQYDPQIGRFSGVDILSDQSADISGYQFSGNNPVSFNDPMGDKFMDPSGNVWHHADGLAGTLAGGQAYEAGFGWDGFGGASGGGGGGNGGGGTASLFTKLFGMVSENGVGVFEGFSSNPGKDSHGNDGTWYSYHYFLNNGVNGGFGQMTTLSEEFFSNFFVNNSSNEQGQQGESNCLNCLDPSTVGHNIFGLSYPGPNNPKSYNGTDNFSYIPINSSEYPAIGHDRRYSNLKINGASGLFLNTKAIGADWQFVYEESIIALSHPNPSDRTSAGIFATLLGLGALGKTIYQIITPGGELEIFKWYGISNVGVNNIPSKH